jgi:hypothetical protein
MFKSAYQSGSFVEVMTTKAQNPLAGWSVGGGVAKVFNRE